ncbi:hypothetical protein ES703_23993 [subsurface metagenome]
MNKVASKIAGFKIKYCNNQFCLENEKKSIVGYLKTKKKNIPICGFRNFCPDAHYHYFNYKPKYVKKEDSKDED